VVVGWGGWVRGCSSEPRPSWDTVFRGVGIRGTCLVFYLSLDEEFFQESFEFFLTRTRSYGSGK
jgi:hypothetical protein